MPNTLPPTGTNDLLDQLSPHIPDQFINELVPPHQGRGRRAWCSSSQLYRLLLLNLLTPVHSFNLLIRLLPEQHAWRRFAGLPNRKRIPTPSQLHDFRRLIGVSGLRRINQHLLTPLLEGLLPERKAVGLIDATDFPASTSAFKKRSPVATLLVDLLWVAGRLRPDRVVGLLATRSTPCVCGSINAATKYC